MILTILTVQWRMWILKSIHDANNKKSNWLFKKILLGIYLKISLLEVVFS